MEKKDLYIIFGPPGSGKTTQSKFIAKTLHLENVSWGDIYNDAEKRNKYKYFFEIINSKETSKELRSKVISNIIGGEFAFVHPSLKGIILDGYPRRIEEAKLLLGLCKKYDLQIKALIRINPSLQRAIERYNSSYTCPICFKDYDDNLTAPIKKGYCDKDGNKLVNNKQSKQKIEKEFYEYFKESKPAYEYLKSHSKTYFDVSGEDDDIVIFSNILLKIKHNEKSDYKIYERKSAAKVETIFGIFTLYTYQSRIDYSHHLVLVKGKITNNKDVMLRVHSSCITGDIFGSHKCECGEQLHAALERIELEGKGLLVYLFQEGRGINIINKIEAYDLQNHGLDTVQANEKLGFPAELREYLPVKDILKDLNVKSVNVLTNNPDKIRKLTDLGVVISKTTKLEVKPGKFNQKYLLTKKVKMGHNLLEV